MALRCVYTDLDGTLLGPGGSFLRDGEGGFTLLAARALEACARAGVEVVPVSGRRRDTLFEDARLLGLSSFVYELGSGFVIDGEHTPLTGDLEERDGESVYDQIAGAGAPQLLFEHFEGRLEYHAPWHEGRSVTHLLRGLVDVGEANRLLEEAGHERLRLVDNGAIATKPSLPGLAAPRAYHLLPRSASKADAVAAHMRAREYAAADCIAVGDSREDLGMAAVVGGFFLVANAVARDEGIGAALPAGALVEVTEATHGEGFYEAVVRSLRGASAGATRWS